MTYQLHKTLDDIKNSVIKIEDDGKIMCIPFNDQLPEYQAFLLWCEQGNTPEPADEV